MPELTERKCPKCGARLLVERVDHHLSGHERLLCPRHGVVGHLGDGRTHGHGRHVDEPSEDDD